MQYSVRRTSGKSFTYRHDSTYTSAIIYVYACAYTYMYIHIQHTYFYTEVDQAWLGKDKTKEKMRKRKERKRNREKERRRVEIKRERERRRETITSIVRGPHVVRVVASRHAAFRAKRGASVRARGLGGRGASFPNRGRPSLTTPFLISVSLPAHCRYYAPSYFDPAVD